jgi:HD-like signal output (HDOD) protein
MNQPSNQAVLLLISKLKNLPALPEASLSILEAINNPEISIEELAETLSLSPGLAARLLGLANSAYFGQQRQINDLPTAIFQVLGLDLVKSLALGIVLNVQFDARKCHAFDSRYFWMRALLTAVAAQKLAKSTRLDTFTPAMVYTSGLLLSIGILVLAYLLPDDLNIILQRHKAHNIPVSREIRSRLGMSHYRLGFFLLQRWQLPPMYPIVLKHMENPEFNGAERSLINCLRMSKALSAQLLQADSVDYIALEALSADCALPALDLAQLVDELIQSREKLQNLAAMMGSS